MPSVLGYEKPTRLAGLTVVTLRTLLVKIKALFLSLLIGFVFPSVALADSDKACAPISETINPTEAQATNDYINLTDGTFGTTAAAEDEFVIGAQVQFHSLYADVDAAPGGTDKWTVTVVDDGTATLLSCNITGSQTSCSNTSNVVTMAAGSDITVLVSSANGTGDPDTAAEIRVGFCADF